MNIHIKVKTKARCGSVIFDEAENIYYVSVTAVPKDGEANIEVVNLLAKHFDISKSQVRLKSGSGNSFKTITLNK